VALADVGRFRRCGILRYSYRQFLQFNDESIRRVVTYFCRRFGAKPGLHGGCNAVQPRLAGGYDGNAGQTRIDALLHILKFMVDAGGKRDFDCDKYTAASGVSVQVNVTAGVPSYFAVLVDDTNFTDAVWNAYTSSNITINLGTTQGWHDVWIGLRGLPPNATQTTMAARPVLRLRLTRQLNNSQTDRMATE